MRRNVTYIKLNLLPPLSYSRLEKVCKKLHFKKYSLYKQGIQDFEATKAKKKNSLKVELLAALVAHPLPLADFFTSNFFFSILPDVISDNMPVLFL